MSDNVSITPGTGITVRTDDVSGIQYQVVKLDLGGDGLSVPVIGAVPVSVGSAAKTTATNTSVNVQLTSTAVVSTNTGRIRLILVNASSSDMYLGLGAAAVSGSGIYLPSVGGSIVLTDWAGTVNALAVNGGGQLLTVCEF